MIIEITTAGPACLPAACPVSTKIPVPMIAPTPSSVRAVALSVFFKCSFAFGVGFAKNRIDGFDL